jgi:hypothetical protein
MQMGRLLSMDKTSPEAAGCFLDRVVVCWVIWHVWKLAGAPEGPTFCSLDVDLAQKGSTSPSEGPDISLLAHNYDIFSI